MPSFVAMRPVTLALGLALLVGTTGAAFAEFDRSFLIDAIQGDNSEVLLGQLALSKGSNEQTKKFAQTLVDDHAKHRIEAAAIVQQMGMIAPSAASSQAGDELTKLQKLSGTAFDQEFASYMVADHEKDISEYKTEVAEGGGAAQQLAVKSIPTLEKHLQMAEALAKM